MTVTSAGLAVLDLDVDPLLSRWVERDGSLTAYDPRIAAIFAPLVPVGGVVVDGGAFIGDHTIAYADAVGQTGRVLAFEPAEPARACLVRNLRHHPWVTIEPVALSDTDGECALAWHASNPGGNHLAYLGRSVVPTRTLDSYALARLDLLKLDLEGHELRALHGAEATIARCRPVILVEVGPQLRRYRDSVDDLVTFLMDAEYRLERVPAMALPDGMTDDAYDLIARPAEVA